MFSEHVGRSKDVKGSTKRKTEKDLKFDELDEKKLAKEVGAMKIDEKREAKYSPQPKEKQEPKESGVNLFKKIVKTEASKGHDLKKDAVGYSLYETANVMCSIVDITKDSTAKRVKNGVPPADKTPKKTNSRASLVSQGSQGPFAQMKEHAEKKRKSFDEEES